MPDSGWVSADSNIAVIRAPDTLQRRRDFLFRHASTALVGVRPGRTRVRVIGIHSDGDDDPLREPPPSTLDREVIVTRPLSRIELTIASDTVVVGRALPIELRVLDDRGAPIEGVPVLLKARQEATTYVSSSLTAWTLVLPGPGDWTVTASLGSHGDTVIVHARRP